MVLLRPFFGSVRTGNPQKVSLPPGSAHRTRGAGYGCPKDVWTRAGPRRASERFFRGVVSFEERSGIGASKCPPREDGREACPTLFGNKWLKSSSESPGDNLALSLALLDRTERIVVGTGIA